MQVLVSIIIPVYNRAHLIAETLNSITGQTYAHWECIVVDDGSTDNTPEVLDVYAQQDSRIVIYKRPEQLPKGPNACRKFGFEKAKGEYISWFDSDDIMHPDRLLKTMTWFAKADVDCVAHNFNYFRPQVYFGQPFNDFGDLSHLTNDYLSGELLLNFPTLLWKASKIDIVHFREDLSYAEDLYFIGNHLLKSDFRVKIVDEVLMNVLKHDISLTSQFAKRDIHLIEQEVYVRQYFWNIFNEQKAMDSKGVLKMYLKALKYYLYVQAYGAFFSKMSEVFIKVNLIMKLKVIKLYSVALFYIFTKKGITYYQKALNAI